ncbi:MAG: PKD domain-containing protein, partial [Gemmatimonadota bacterium]|nr:PKD domain-containing protein [Gemmatimonadota bacterium]
MRRLLLSRRSGLLALSLALSLFSVGCAESDVGTGPNAPDLQASRTSSPPGHTIRDAIRAQERHTAGLMRTKGVVGTGVGLDADGTPVVRVFTSEPGVPGLPGQLDDIPVQVRVTGLFVAGTTARERPAPVGYSVGHTAITAGTHGGVVKNGAGDTFILSNNHVLANSNDANIGDAILQPGPFDGGQDPADRIGTLADFEPIDFSGAFNKLDAAIAAVAPGDVDPSTPADGYGVINAVPYPLDGDGDGAVDGSLLGLDVQKYGRTTQLTTGQVTEINVTANVCYEVLFGLFCTKSANFEDLLGFPAMSQGGDSGSSIVTTDGTNRAVGLLFAGSSTSTLASRIDLVLQRFGVAYDDGSGGGNQPPTASFTHACTDLDCAFDGSGSTDDGSITLYEWDFGDGNGATGVSPSHTYAAAGDYDVVLTVTDDGGLQDTDTQTVTATDPGGNQPPTASFTHACTDLDCAF